MKKPTKKTFYSAAIGFRFRNATGAFETKLVATDVTDDVAEGANEEHLVDSLFYHKVKDRYDDVECFFCGVYPQDAIADLEKYL